MLEVAHRPSSGPVSVAVISFSSNAFFVMGVCACPSGRLLVCLTLLVSVVPPLIAWDADLELLDLVEEIPQTFYQFLSLDQDASAAEIKKAYRRLSLTLHPDKNKDENAETQFRQLVAIYEVLKDEERRRRYDDILVNGLPDWRQPVFYYRRVRKMSNAELGFLLFLILTVGHYAVIWSIYLEKQLDELLSKKKKEKKKKLSSKPAEELRCISQDRTDRVQERPHWQDILPLKLSIWLYLSVKNLPQTIQEVKQYYEDYQQMKQQQQQQQQEDGKAEQEAMTREKRPKFKKPKVEFPVYEPSSEILNYQSYDQTTSIEEIEDQMDNWLQDRKAAKKKASDWTEDELSLLSRLMVKFPGGTQGRWEKIAHELGRSVSDVTTKVKQIKDNVSHTSGLVKLSELKGLPPVRSHPAVSVMTQNMGGGCEEEEEEEEEAGTVVRRRNRKSSAADGGEVKIRGRRQKDFDPAAVEDEVEPQESREKVDPAAWSQSQQKLLELALQQYPRGTVERWDRIAKVVPGKTKEECMIRYKMLAELVQKRKQAKS
uniref:dnaJ homolog subfamily C member 1 isoform X1 n=1 Tax=Monopterus albus TaxID=43700 RepID=UPI0009B42F48|nr:dnaJ homolog subfamily C member 1 isoform X1 [Monopterus albus]